MKLESLIGSSEYYLSLGASIPFAGFIPAAIKCGMGGIQCLTGFACTIIFSIATCIDSDYKNLRNRSASHVVHGAANVVISFVEGTSFGGFVLTIVRLIKSTSQSVEWDRKTEMTKEMENVINQTTANTIKTVSTINPIYKTTIGKKFEGVPTDYLLISSNSFKFMGYKVLQEDDTYTYYQKKKLTMIP